MGYSWDFLPILDNFLKSWDGMGYLRLSKNTPKPIPYGMGWDSYEIVVPLPKPVVILTIGIRGGITRQFWGDFDWGRFRTWESIPGHVLGPRNQKIK